MSIWLLLVAAIAAEVSGTTAMKLSEGFTRTGPTAWVVASYSASFVLLAQVLKSMDVGVAYAIWSGLGTAFVALIGVYYFGEPVTAGRVLSLTLIIIGVVGLQISGTSH